MLLGRPARPRAPHLRRRGQLNAPELLLPAQARLARPWRNGGGATRDICIFPESASDEEFLWQASLATIAGAGPFSAWPGVDRFFMLLEGELALSIDEAVRRLHGGEPAIAFAGEAAVAAEPIGNACTALNLMARRALARARLERWSTGRPSAADQLLLVTEAATTVRLAGRSIGLATHDALRLDAADVATLQVDRPVVVAELFLSAR